MTGSRLWNRSAGRCFSIVCLSVAAIAASAARAAEPAPGMLGVTLRDDGGRVFVKDVYLGGPAQRAGLRPGDRILAVGDKAVSTIAELVETLAAYEAGARIEIRASRDGWSKELPATLGKREEVAGLPLMLQSRATPQARTRNAPVQPAAPLVHPSPFYRKRNERW
jgi:S1-C subfamily serine protease